MRTVPDSPSLVLSASHITLVTVLSAEYGTWASEQPAQRQASVELRLKLEEVLKGAIADDSPRTVDLIVTQSQRTVGRVFAVPGVWSEQNLQAGEQFLVFTNAASDRPESFLAEAVTRTVRPAGDTLADTRRVINAVTSGDSITAVLDVAGGARSTLGDLWATYLVTRIEEPLFDGFEAFDAILGFVEQQDLELIVRTIVFEAVAETLTDRQSVPPEFASRFVHCGFRLLELPEAAGMHDNLVIQDLPDFLNAEETTDDRSAKQMFASAPAELEHAEKALRAYPNSADATPLLEWLRD